MSDFSTSRYRKARKQHTCGECRLPIEPGATYLRIAGATDGYGWSEALCLRCEALHEAVTECAKARGYTDDNWPTVGGAVTWILETEESPKMTPETSGWFAGLVFRRNERAAALRERRADSGAAVSASG